MSINCIILSRLLGFILVNMTLVWDGKTFREKKVILTSVDVASQKNLWYYSLSMWDSNRVHVSPQLSHICKLPIQCKRKDTKSVNRLLLSQFPDFTLVHMTLVQNV